MAKVYKIVDPDEPQTSGQCLTTNWDLCVLCQEETVELLKCPANSACGTERAGYKTLAENLEAFDRISCLPGTQDWMRVRVSRQHSGFTRPNGMTHADCSLTKQNSRGLKRGKCLTNMIQNQNPANSPV